MKNLIVILCTGCVLALLNGCASTAPKFEPRARASLTTATITNDLNPELLRPGDGHFTLGPGDQMEIEISGTPTSRAEVTVGPDGKIYFNILPGMDVWGLTLTQTRSLLERELSKYISSPQVTLTLRAVASKSVWLLGRLDRPGIYPVTGPMTLLEAIALAGGVSRSGVLVTTEELASLRRSFVIRDGHFVPVDFYRLLREGDMSQNIYLQPNDFIYVPSTLAQEVYVFGSVKSPRAVRYGDQMTLVSAIANAAGPRKFDFLSINQVDYGPFTRDANLSRIAIVRGSLTTPEIAIVNYSDIIKGKTPDVPLEPGDIIYVPNSPYTTLKRYVNMIVNTFVATVAANEGTRAGGGELGVGVSVPAGR